jgi:hypothetical protein
MFAAWIRFSADRCADGATAVQVNLLLRANDPLYELAMPVVIHRQEDMFWRQTLTNLARHFGVPRPVVIMNRMCVDPRRQWRKAGNVWRNAGIRSAVYLLGTPLRRAQKGRRRVGAIHALDRIAAEAPTERAGVVALLATYVRVRAHRGWTGLDDPDLPLRSRASDIQAALTTITHWIEPGPVPPQWLIADLPNANLHGCTLWPVRMRDVNLTGADLTDADVRGADLRNTVLDDVDFTGARPNRRTWWPTGFDPQAHSISIEQTEAAYTAWPPKTPGA